MEASQGHVRDLPKSQIGVDVDNDFEPKYITIRGRGEILNRIRKEARGGHEGLPRDRPGPRGRSHFLASGQRAGHRSSIRPAALSSTRSPMKAVKAAVKTPARHRHATWSTPSRRAACSTGWWAIRSVPSCGSKVRQGPVRRARAVGRHGDDRASARSEIEAFQSRGILDHRRAISIGEACDRPLTRRQNGEKADAEKPEECRRRDPAGAQERGLPWPTSSAASAASSPLRRSPLPICSRRPRASWASPPHKTMQIAQQLYEGVDIEGEGAQGCGDLYPHGLHPHLR